MAMADAQLYGMPLEDGSWRDGTYQGKLLEARDQADYKDEVVLAILTLPILVLAYGVWSDDPAAMDKIKMFSSTIFRPCLQLVYEFMDTCMRQHFWYKGYSDI